MSAWASQFSWLALLTGLASLHGKLALEAAGIDRAPLAAGSQAAAARFGSEEPNILANYLRAKPGFDICTGFESFQGRFERVFGHGSRYLLAIFKPPGNHPRSDPGWPPTQS